MSRSKANAIKRKRSRNSVQARRLRLQIPVIREVFVCDPYGPFSWWHPLLALVFTGLIFAVAYLFVGGNA